MNQEKNNKEIDISKENTIMTNQQSQYDAPGMTYRQWMLTLLLLFIPVVNIILMIIWTTGGGNHKERKNFSLAYLTWTAISFVLSFVLIFLVVGIGVSMADNTNGSKSSFNTYNQSEEFKEGEDLLNEDIPDSNNEYDPTIEDTDNDATSQEGFDQEKSQFQYVEAVDIGTPDHPLTTYALSGNLSTYEGFATGGSHGITHSVSVVLEDYHESLSRTVDLQIEDHREIYEGVDAYSDFVLSDKFAGDTWEVQQLNYNLTLNGTTYPCFYIVKADTASDGRFLVNVIDYNSSLGDDESKAVLGELYGVTGIEFEFN